MVTVLWGRKWMVFKVLEEGSGIDGVWGVRVSDLKASK